MFRREFLQALTEKLTEDFDRRLQENIRPSVGVGVHFNVAGIMDDPNDPTVPVNFLEPMAIAFGRAMSSKRGSSYLCRSGSTPRPGGCVHVTDNGIRGDLEYTDRQYLLTFSTRMYIQD